MGSTVSIGHGGDDGAGGEPIPHEGDGDEIADPDPELDGEELGELRVLEALREHDDDPFGDDGHGDFVEGEGDVTLDGDLTLDCSSRPHHIMKFQACFATTTHPSQVCL